MSTLASAAPPGSTGSVVLAYIPSPSEGVVHLGPIPLRAYAFCIIIGAILGIWWGSRRWVARGGRPGAVGDIAVWAIPFGLVGARAYSVITDYELYFGPGRHPIDAFKVWNGGLGIWGAVALGALGAWIGARRNHIKLPALLDAVAPGILIAQACGRWGNWFNQELFGRPTTLPWGLKIDYIRNGAVNPNWPGPQYPPDTLFQPTFLYESLWCLGAAALIVWADRKWRLGHGRVFFLYVAVYTVGRGWIEDLRIDYAHRILGIRINDWMSALVFVAAVIAFIVSARRHPGRETELYRDVPQPTTTPDSAASAPADRLDQPAPSPASSSQASSSQASSSQASSSQASSSQASSSQASSSQASPSRAED